MQTHLQIFVTIIVLYKRSAIKFIDKWKKYNTSIEQNNIIKEKVRQEEIMTKLNSLESSFDKLI